MSCAVYDGERRATLAGFRLSLSWGGGGLVPRGQILSVLSLGSGRRGGVIFVGVCSFLASAFTIIEVVVVAAVAHPTPSIVSGVFAMFRRVRSAVRAERVFARVAAAYTDRLERCSVSLRFVARSFVVCRFFRVCALCRFLSFSLAGRIQSSANPSLTSIFANTLIDIATEDRSVVGITAAMPGVQAVHRPHCYYSCTPLTAIIVRNVLL